MSGVSESAMCPKCKGTMDTYNDWKPHDYVQGTCLDCGFYYRTESDFLSLEDLNAERAEAELPPLKRLPPRRGICCHCEDSCEPGETCCGDCEELHGEDADEINEARGPRMVAS